MGAHWQVIYSKITRHYRNGRCRYETSPAEGGKFKVHAEITQSEMDEHFAMLLPLFADFGNTTVRLGQVEVVGNSTRNVNFVLDKQPKKVMFNAFKDILER